MKRFLAMIVSVTLALTFAACGNNESDTPESSGTAAATEPAEDNSAADDAEKNTDGNEENVDAEENPPAENEGDTADSAPLNILNRVWNSYGDDEKFSVVGGDMSEENVTTDAPGKYSIEDAAVLDSTLGYPAASVDKIDDAASIVHMLNGNTFTCGAYHVANADDTDAVVADIKDNIMNRQWICGFPEKLVIITVDDCVVAFFGAADLTGAFRDALLELYPTAQVAVEDDIE